MRSLTLTSLILFNVSLSLYAQDLGFRYQWEGKKTEAVSYKNWKLTEHPMDSSLGVDLGAVCNIAPVSRWPGSTIDVCQKRLGTCLDSAGKWGFNNLFLAHCGKSSGVKADGMRLDLYHAYGSIVRNASLKAAVFTNSDLHELFMDSSNISDSVFYKTNLFNVDMNNVNAKNARFDKANFVVNSGDYYYGVGKGTDFFFGASNFENAQFFESRMQANFQGANLRNANFQRVGRFYPNDGTEFVKVTAGNLDSAYFGQAQLQRLDINITSVNKLDAYRAQIKNITLIGARGSDLFLGEIKSDELKIAPYGSRSEHQPSIKNINLSKAQIKQIMIGDAPLVENMYLGDSEIESMQIHRSSMPGLSLVRVQSLKKLLIRESQVTGAAFRNANLSAAKFCKSNLSGSDFNGANLAGAKYDSGTQLPFNDQVAAQRGMILTDEACSN